jgi:uncharacterized protein
LPREQPVQSRRENDEEAAPWLHNDPSAFGRSLQHFRHGFEAYNDGDFTKAGRLYRQAAEWGVARAQYNLAQMHYHGEGIPRDLAKSAFWFEQATMQGIAQAQHNIGLAYDEGYGVDVDKSRAARWYQKAAAGGMLNSMQNLGLMYANGDGVPKSYDRALPLLWNGAPLLSAEDIMSSGNRFGGIG